MKYEYELKVLRGEGLKYRNFVVQSPVPVSDKILSVVGMILDGHYNSVVVDDLHPLAATYVSVDRWEPAG